VSCDPQLGPVLLFGSGGVMVEVYNDVALRRCPITRAEAQAMIAEVKGARLLQGFRDGQRRTSGARGYPGARVHTSPYTWKDICRAGHQSADVLPEGQGVKAVDRAGRVARLVAVHLRP